MCVWTVHVYLLQVSSASSEPSGHSGSPSHRQRPGTHWPFKQANSAGAHVFLAGQRNKEEEEEGLWGVANLQQQPDCTLTAHISHGDQPSKHFEAVYHDVDAGHPGTRLRAVCDITSPGTTRLFWTWYIFWVSGVEAGIISNHTEDAADWVQGLAQHFWGNKVIKSSLQ